MTDSLWEAKTLLDPWVIKRDTPKELSKNATADPLQVASVYKQDTIALICALFAYGNARAIVNFLNSLDFSLLSKSEKQIRQNSKALYYRFQSQKDIEEFFITLRRVEQEGSLKNIFLENYTKTEDTLKALSFTISKLYSLNKYRSRGYEFLIGKSFKDSPKSPYKRWFMYLRWMVRKDNLDMGLWNEVSTSHLYAPLDTHTHKMALKLGLVKRKTYDFKTVLELTNTFKLFDKNDPIKYDFALYRLGQEKIII